MPTLPLTLLSIRFSLLGLLIVLTTACATVTEHHLYEGAEKPATELMVVDVPVHLEIMTINGKALASGGSKLLGTTEQKLHLLPGKYFVDAYYKQLWDDTIEGHTVVRSQPATFIVEGAAGDAIELDFERPERQHQASQLAKNFSGWSYNLTTNTKTPTAASQTRRPSLLASMQDGAPPPDTTATVKPLPDPKPVDKQNLIPMLKAFWSEASAEEKREFLLWISE